MPPFAVGRAVATVRAMDLTAVEDALRRIPEVRAARIVADGTGRPVEVHILATTGKAPKQLVRDVQSVAIASAGVEFDHRIVSVVQLEDEGMASSSTSPTTEQGTNGSSSGGVATLVDRVVVDNVLVARQGLRAHATVTLRRGDVSVVGNADGTIAMTTRHRIVAEACLNALRLLEPAAVNMAVEFVGVQSLGDRRVGFVTLILVAPPHEELLAGVAPVHGNVDEEAVARAVLDATNRRLSQLA